MTTARTSRRLAAALLAGTLALGLAACGDDDKGSDGTTAPTTAGTSAGASPVTVVGPQDGQQLMADMGAALTVIDVRTPEEFAAGHIEGAINLDLEGGNFSADIKGLDHAAAYLVYCHSGRRSALAAQAMAEDGFTAIYDMGGIQAWQDAGLPIVTG